VRECVFEYGCGAAHGHAGCTLQVFDLKTGSTTDVEGFLRGWQEPDRLRAMRQVAFQEILEPDEQGYRFEGSIDEMDLTAVWPRWVNGSLQFKYQFTGWTCYACTDGRWGAYTVSGRASTAQLPPRSVGYRTAPHPVRAYWSSTSTDASHGWSQIPLAPRKREAVWKSFSKE
jgi:hypothetical protein